MKVPFLRNTAFSLAAAGLALAPAVEAKQPPTHHHVAKHHRHKKVAKSDPGHGHCLRFNKKTGALAGAVGGAVLGKVIFGGPIAIVGGAAAGGLAGNKLARNGKKHCR